MRMRRWSNRQWKLWKQGLKLRRVIRQMMQQSQRQLLSFLGRRGSQMKMMMVQRR